MTAGDSLRREVLARRTVLTSGPAVVSVELTGRCNVKPACLFCTGKNHPAYREPDHLSEAQLARYWPILARSERTNDCSYGEPLTHPGFEAFVRRLTDAGVRFGFTTNGTLLSESRRRFLIERRDTVDFVVSVNAARPETYHWLHGMKLGLLLEKLEALVRDCERDRPGSPPPFALSYIVMRSNLEEIPAFLRMARTLGVRVVQLRPLFDMGVPDFPLGRLGRPFVYEDERLGHEEHLALEARVRAEPIEGLTVQAVWNARDSFMAEQAEQGSGLPCVFPWKFLAIRPIHDEYAPCPFLKVSIAAPSLVTPDALWNGPSLVEMREALAAGRLPALCLEKGLCPLVAQARPP